MSGYSESDWAKIAGPNHVFVNAADVAPLLGVERVYGLLDNQIVAVRTVERAELCERVWVSRVTVSDLVRKARA